MTIFLYNRKNNKIQSLTKGWSQFTKLSQIGFSVECFTADFLQFFTKKRQIWLLGGRLGTRHQIQAFPAFY